MTTRDCPECGYNAACSPDCKTGTHPRDVRVPAPEEGTGGMREQVIAEIADWWRKDWLSIDEQFGVIADRLIHLLRPAAQPIAHDLHETDHQPDSPKRDHTAENRQAILDYERIAKQ
jgi:hypothetical protein